MLRQEYPPSSEKKQPLQETILGKEPELKVVKKSIFDQAVPKKMSAQERIKELESRLSAISKENETYKKLLDNASEIPTEIGLSFLKCL